LASHTAETPNRRDFIVIAAQAFAGVGAAMAFPGEYVVLGNQRQKVKQYGNAVTPPVMQLLIERCLEVLN